VPALPGVERAGMCISLCVGFGGLYGQRALSVLCCAMCACARHTPVCIGRLLVRMRMMGEGGASAAAGAGCCMRSFFGGGCFLGFTFRIKASSMLHL
jgi:hypothetical protein